MNRSSSEQTAFRWGHGSWAIASLLAVATLLATASLLTACSGDDGPPLTASAEEGRDVARSLGCAACHGRNGEGGVGPSWAGLHGTTVALEGGTTVVADDDYIRRSILEPTDEIVAGYTVVMPNNNLDDGQIDAVVAYIRELG